MAELYPVLAGLCALAKGYDIGLNIDAEEADRLEPSLDLLERLAFEPQLQGWDGLGFVVQAYQQRCPFVIDHLVDLARRSGRRLMVRLVKGAYWDSEIKRAQVEGQAGYPVYTRKAHTDVAYLACARKLLDATDAVYPQFATHNAHTLGRRLPAGRSGALDAAAVRVPVPARHGRAAVRAGRGLARCRPAGPALPHLRAGGHARNPAGLPGAPPAGERRQHLLRAPHRRPGDSGRPTGAGPRGPGRTARARGRHRRAAAPRDPAAARHLPRGSPQFRRHGPCQRARAGAARREPGQVGRSGLVGRCAAGDRHAGGRPAAAGAQPGQPRRHRRAGARSHAARGGPRAGARRPRLPRPGPPTRRPSAHASCWPAPTGCRPTCPD